MTDTNSHNAQVVEGSLQVNGMDIHLTIRCCNDPQTDYSITIHEAHKYPKEALTIEIDRLKTKRAEQHAALDMLKQHLEHLNG